MRIVSLAFLVFLIIPLSHLGLLLTPCEVYGQDKNIWAPIDTVRQIDFDKWTKQMEEFASPRARFVLVDTILSLRRVAMRLNESRRAQALLDVADRVLCEIDRDGTTDDRNRVETIRSKIETLRQNSSLNRVPGTDSTKH